MNYPEVAKDFAILTSWVDEGGVIVLAVNDKTKKVRVHLWDGIAKSYLQYFEFDKYEAN